MKVIIPPIHERLKDGADPAKLDVFGRKKFADNLTNLFSNTSDGLVLTVNSNWGDGKTSFIKLWEKELEADSRFIPIYYDAFSNDFTDDAFLSIAVEIHRSFEKELGESGKNAKKNSEQLEALKEQAKNITKGFIRMGTRMAVSSLTAGLIDSEKVVQKVAEGADKILYGTLEHDAEAKFDSHLNVKKIIEGYRDQLKVMLSLDKDNPKKIIFFVDELDRCRPDFAIQVIEKIKHLFSVDNVFFVLAINKTQLMRTIQSAYGVSEEDSRIYLQKFVHLETILLPLGRHTKMAVFIEKLIVGHGLTSIFEENSVTSAEFAKITELYKPFLNPRAVERFFTLIAIAIGSSPSLFQQNEEALRSLCLMAMIKICALDDSYVAYRGGQFKIDTSHARDSVVGRVVMEFFKFKSPKTSTFPVKINMIPKVCNVLDIYNFPQELSVGNDFSELHSDNVDIELEKSVV